MNDYLKNLNLIQRLVVGFIDWLLLHQVQRVKPIDYSSKYRVLSIQLRASTVRDKELAAISIRPAIGHRQYTPSVVFQTVHDFVFKWLTVNALSTLPCVGWVAALDDEPLDVAVKDCIVVLAACC